MATKTIYGCVNLANGQVTFEGEACEGGNYIGCVELSGEHVGQVKVVISEANCDDTYYGCVNAETGKFQLVIPDDCCVGMCDDDCGCWGVGLTPKYYQVSFSEVNLCSGESWPGDVNLNRIWRLTCSETLECTWKGGDGYWSIKFHFYRDVEWEHPILHAGARAGGEVYYCFPGEGDELAPCTKSGSNQPNGLGDDDVGCGEILTAGCGCDEYKRGYGGTADFYPTVAG